MIYILRGYVSIIYNGVALILFVMGLMYVLLSASILCNTVYYEMIVLFLIHITRVVLVLLLLFSILIEDNGVRYMI